MNLDTIKTRLHCDRRGASELCYRLRHVIGCHLTRQVAGPLTLAVSPDVAVHGDCRWSEQFRSGRQIEVAPNPADVHELNEDMTTSRVNRFGHETPTISLFRRKYSGYAWITKAIG